MRRRTLTRAITSRRFLSPSHGTPLVLVCLVITIAACDSGAAPPTASDHEVTYDSVGPFVVVRNQGPGLWPDATSSWEIIEDLKIPDARAGEYILEVPVAVSVGPGGDILVADRGGDDLKRFDSEGRFLGNIGRRGQGPGEFRSPAAMAWDPTGRLWVVDWNRRYSVFSPSGDLLKTVPRQAELVGFRQILRFESGASLIDQAPMVSPGGSPTPGFVRADTTGVVLEEFPPVSRPQVFRDGRDRFVPNFPQDLTRLIPRAISALGQDSTIWFARSDTLRLVKRTLRGDTLRIIEASHRPSSLTGEDERLIRDSLQARGLNPQDFLLSSPVVRGIVVLDDGHLLVQIGDGEGTDSTTFDVFDAGGRYLGPVTAPFPVDARVAPSVSGDAVHFVSPGPLGEYRIIRSTVRRR